MDRMSPTRYTPQEPDYSRRFGTKRRDSNNDQINGEFNQNSDPLGTRAESAFASALTNFQGGGGNARPVAPPAGPAVGSRTGTPLPTPAGVPAPDALPPAPSASQSAFTLARARFGNQTNIDPATVAAAGTGQTMQTPFGTISSRRAGPNEIATDGVSTPTGVVHLTQGEQMAKNTAASSPWNMAMRAGPTKPFTPGAAPAGTLTGRDRSDMGFATTVEASPSKPVPRPIPKGMTDFPRMGLPGGRYGGTGDIGIPGQPVLSAPPVYRTPPLPMATSSHPPTKENAATAASLRPQPKPFRQSWRLPWASEPAPDFPPANMAGGRPGGTGGVSAPLASPFGRPRKPATPLMDKVAQGY